MNRKKQPGVDITQALAAGARITMIGQGGSGGNVSPPLPAYLLTARKRRDLPLVAQAIAIVIANRSVFPDMTKQEFWRAIQEVEPNYPSDAFERHWAQSGRP